jgi:hypothetical protein
VAAPAAKESPYVGDELATAERFHIAVFPFWIAGQQ